MPDNVILDSSVIAALFFFRDASSEKAANAVAEKNLMALDLSMAEVGNVAWKRVVHFQEDPELTFSALQECMGFISQACALIRASDLISEAYRIAVEDKIAFYDSLFLAATEKENAPLLTMDRKLYEKARGKRNVQMI
ncbi:MAG: type II toxin-antitoxin system VapC family toxin [Methanothrix sp.]|nr:type II toxin-antitoxin system VapC family toxin [Methanothrix sp.]